MPADYIVVSKDEPTTIGHAVTTFTISKVPPLAGGRQIVQFMVHTENANSLRVRMRVNEHTAWQYGPTDTGMTRPFHDTVSILEEGDDNTIDFQIIGGTGTFLVSSIIVWFRVP